MSSVIYSYQPTASLLGTTHQSTISSPSLSSMYFPPTAHVEKGTKPLQPYPITVQGKQMVPKD